MDVVVVCHTEFGLVDNKKVIPNKKAVSGARDGVLNLIKIAEKYGAKISFAVCPEVVEYFPKNINHEIGLHVHPGWERLGESKDYIGDAYLRKHCKQSSFSSVLWDYSYEEQFNMIKIGKEYLVEKLGIVPKFFVAGRWCLNNDTVKALVDNSFTHDYSAPAHSKPSHHDWSQLPRICMPYHPSKNNYQKKGDLPILMVPISQYIPIGNINPESIPTVGLSWLKSAFLEYYNQNMPLFHICLHSPSMTDEYFIRGTEELFSFISKHKNINFRFASEIKEYPEVNPKTNILPYVFGLNKEIISTFINNKILNSQK